MKFENYSVRRLIFCVLIGVMALGLTIQNGYAQGGPPGGSVRALAIDPSTPATLYAGTGGAGVFKSTNRGASWTPANSGLTTASVSALVIDPSTPTTVYAGTGSGVFKSTDGGTNWTAVNSGLTYPSVTALAIDPLTPTTLYAGTYHDGTRANSVFKSTNGGTSWTAVGLPNADVYALAIAPSTPATLYAGTANCCGGGDVFKSTDGGTSWAAVNVGLANATVYSLAIDPFTPATLYAGTFNGGVFKSTNGGASWTAVNSGLPDPNTVVYALGIFSLAINPADPATLYAGTFNGVFKTQNGGTSWIAVNNGLPDPTTYGYAIARFALAIDPSTPDTLYTGSAYYGVGVFKSTDGGASWTTANSGLGNTAVQALAIDPSAPATLYVGPDGGGVFKSINGGTSWAAVNVGLANATVYSLAIDPFTPATLYAGTLNGGVFKSTNGGASWTAVNSGITTPLRVFYALAIDPLTPSTLYAGGAGVFKSTNGGTSWTAVNSGLTAFGGVHALAIDPSNPVTLYAGTDGGGVFKSTNGGTSWTAVNNGSSPTVPQGLGSSHVYALAIDPSTPSTLYAGAPDPSGTSTRGVFKSTNGGTNWARAGSFDSTLNIQDLAIDPFTPATLYGGTSRGGVFKSTNGGTNWTAINSGLTITNVQTLAIDPFTPATLYAGTSGGGVFKSTNGGVSWQPTGSALAFTASQCDTVSFAAKTDFGTGSFPRSVAVGDFNGDGKLDLAVANSGAATVSILLGTGTGTFGTKTDFGTSDPLSVAVGDFNGDGKLDLAVANYGTNTVSILLGTGTGSLGAKTDSGTGSGPFSVAVGDFNGDGKLDLAVANNNNGGAGTVSILLGTGTGSFGAKTDFGTGDGPSSVAVGDFNGDGKLDLAVANDASNTVSILLGTGTGSFGAKTDFGTGISPASVAVGDFNGDGKLDLAVANFNSTTTVSILLGTGTGSFGAKTDFGTSLRPVSVAVEDFNGDGKLDLAVANFSSGTVSILLGAGTGSFGAKTNFGTGIAPTGVAAGDFNGDGKLDLAVANQGSKTVSILLNTCSNTSPSITAISPAVPPRSNANQSVVVTGNSFQQNLTVTLTFPSGASTTLSGAQIQSVTSNSFTMLTTLDASGSWSLRVNNPDGGQSNTFNFTVGSGPLISAISPPSPVASGSDQNIPVFGSGFQPNLSVSVTFPNGDGTTLSGPGQIQNVTPTSFTMVVTLNATGTWRIRVNNPNGGGQSNTYSFAVRAAAPTIDDINPDPVTAGVDTALIVSGINFRSGFSASVTTPDGTSNISSSQLTFITSTEIRVRVTMHGTPQYQATLRIFYSNGQSTTGTFQVQGTSTTGPLAGTIAIWDGQKPYKFRTANLPGSGVTLQVYARPSSNPNGQPINASVTDSQYSFPSDAFLPNTDYDIHVELTYSDIIDDGVKLPCFDIFCSPCVSSDSTRKTSLVKSRLRPSTLGSQALDFDFKPPIILAHGIWSCFSDKWHSDSTNNITYWENYLRSVGFITFTPNYDWHISTSNGTNGISHWENRAILVAGQIRRDFAGLTGETSADYPPWVYVGHSMGGLIGRVFTNMSDDPLVSRLKKMYLLGTPNSGSFGAGERTMKDYLSIPYIRKTFNAVYPDFFGSRSTTLSKVKAYAGKWNQWAGSDTLVNVDDVFNVIQQTDKPLAKDPSVTLYRLPGKVFVYGHTTLGGPNSRNCILINQILPEVCQIQGSQNAVSPCPVAQGTCDQDDGAPARPSRPETDVTIATSPRIITSDVFSLTASQTLTIPFQVAATDAISVTAFSTSAQIAFSILDPSGQVVDFASLPPTVGQVVSNELGQFLSLNNPSPGIWSLRAMSGPDAVTISMAATENSPTGFEGFVNPSNAITGETPHLTGQWVGATNGISSASMSAKLTDESGTTVATVSLLDDGNHGDGAAGDGEFGGDAPAISIAGRYSVIFTTQGNINGQAFWRWGAALLDVVSPTHTFTGSFNDVAIDSDLDGAYDILRENVEISVGTAGGYLVAADLYDAQGYFISHAVGYTQVAAGGVYSVGLNFTVSGAFCIQFSSEFTVKNLTLRNAGALTVLDVYAQNVTTLTYDGSLFGCVSGTPSPSISSVQPNSMFPSASGQVVIGGSSFLNGAQVSFGAGVNVSSVTFGGSTTLIAQVIVSQGATPGPRDVIVTNPDGHSSTGIALFSVASDQPPAVSINNIADQQVVSSTVTVSATASDDLGVQKVEFYADGVLSGTDTSFPYQLVWDTSSLVNGIHTLAAKAYDTANQTSQQQINVVVSCISSLSSNGQSFPVEGGASSVNITASNSCSWSAVSNSPWIIITSGGGSGNGTVNYSVAANDTINQRTGTMTIAAQTFTVNQAGAGCTYSLATTNQFFGAGAGTGGVSVMAGNGCNWSAVSNAPGFITVTSGSTGSGNGMVTYSVTANNTLVSRTGTLTIAGHIFTVTQTADTDGDGIPDVVEAIEGTNPLVKDNAIFTNARLFVMQQYRDFLGREGEPGGITFWTNLINSGSLSRAQVIDSFFNSPEFQGTVSPVTRLYFAYFLRIPDYGGLIFWVNQYRQGATLDSISQAFAASPEFQSTYGSLSNTQFVTLVYQNVLGREPDPGGLAFWVGQLNSGAMTRGSVMLGFSESPEYKQSSFNKVYVTMIYVGMLRRAPEQGGFDFWVNALNSGASGLNLIQGFLNAPEYHSRFLP